MNYLDFSKGYAKQLHTYIDHLTHRGKYLQ